MGPIRKHMSIEGPAGDRHDVEIVADAKPRRPGGFRAIGVFSRDSVVIDADGFARGAPADLSLMTAREARWLADRLNLVADRVDGEEAALAEVLADELAEIEAEIQAEEELGAWRS